MLITAAVAQNVRNAINAGLAPETFPRQSIKQAVCSGLGFEPGEEADLIEPVLRSFVIELDNDNWYGETARLDGMRDLAIAQLGTADVLDGKAFSDKALKHVVQTVIPKMIRLLAEQLPEAPSMVALREAADRLEAEGSLPAIDAAYAAFLPVRSEMHKRGLLGLLEIVADAHQATGFLWEAVEAADAMVNHVTHAVHAVSTASYVVRDITRAHGGDSAAARDQVMKDFTGALVGILAEMKAPAIQFVMTAKAA